MLGAQRLGDPYGELVEIGECVKALDTPLFVVLPHAPEVAHAAEPADAVHDRHEVLMESMDVHHLGDPTNCRVSFDPVESNPCSRPRSHTR